MLVAGDGQGYPLILFILAAGLAGDVFLSRPGTRSFLVGMASFAILHALLIAWFIGLGISLEKVVSPGSLLFLVFAAGFAWLLFQRAGALRWPVLGYVSVIAAMALTAIGIDTAQINSFEVATLQVAVALFVVSDALIGVEVFMLPSGSRWRVPAQLCIWPTYFVAMAAFVFVALG